jgi:2-polyprenyl-6-methoxyphenol hydroxylase-like FAD-dependent oxidoreductase
LQEALVAAAVERGVDIQFDSQVVKVNLEAPLVALKDGRMVLDADLIIGADGK